MKALSPRMIRVLGYVIEHCDGDRHVSWVAGRNPHHNRLTREALLSRGLIAPNTNPSGPRDRQEFIPTELGRQVHAEAY